MRALLAIALIVSLALAWSASTWSGRVQAQPNTFYVAPTGSDANPGTLAQPWRTIQHAADLAQPGDTVYVRAGTYAESVTLSTSGAPGSPITIAAYSGEVVALSESGQWAGFVVAQGVSHVVLDGFRLRGYRETGVDVRGGNSYVTLANLDASGASSGVRVTWGYSGDSPLYGPVDHLTLRDSRLHDNSLAGFDCTPGPCRDLVFQRLTIENNGVGAQSFGADGLAVERGYPILVEDVVIRNNGGDGLDLNSRDGGPTPGVVVRRCVVAGNRYNGVKLWASARLENCLITDTGLTPLVLGAFSNVAMEVVNTTVAYNMVDGRDYAVRGWAVDAGSPGGDGQPAPTNVRLTLRNNIFAFNAYADPDGQTGLYLGPGVTLTETNNLYYSREDGEVAAEFVVGRDQWFTRAEIADGTWMAWTGQGAGDVTADPLFANMLGGDFQLRPGSPAVDAGIALGAPAVDLRGRPRAGLPDLGAYELSSSGTVPTPTPTAMPTPTATPTTSRVQLIRSGRFETGTLRSWITGGAVRPTASSERAHRGSYSARLGFASGLVSSSLQQQVTIPADATSAILTFWYWPYSEDTSWDWQAAWLRDTGGGVLAQLMTVRENDRVWKRRSYNLTEHKGRTIQIYFEVRNNLSRPTGMYLDDVQLVVWRSLPASTP